MMDFYCYLHSFLSIKFETKVTVEVLRQNKIKNTHKVRNIM